MRMAFSCGVSMFPPAPPEPPIDTILGVEIFSIIHVNTQEKIYVSLEDIKNG